jgi:transcriptional regulator GlxA family with amidase domain
VGLRYRLEQTRSACSCLKPAFTGMNTTRAGYADLPMTRPRTRVSGSANARRTARRPPLTVGFLLTPGFTLLPFAGFIDALRLGADEGDRSRPIHCGWEVIAPDRHPIRSSSGVTVVPTADLGDPREFDYIVVVGGVLRSLAHAPGYIEEYLRRAATLRVPLIGVCTGSFVLARADLMAGQQCCVSWFHHDEFVAEFPDARVVSDRLFLADGDRITCAGGSSAIHLASYLIDLHCGPGRALKGLRIMIEDQLRPAGTPQPQPATDRFRSTSNPTVRRALLILEREMVRPPSISELAARVHSSVRNLERLFRTHLGVTPAALLMSLRVEEARRLVSDTALPLARVSELCGFRDAAHFSRRFRQAFKESPLQARRRTRRMEGADDADKKR